MVRDPDRTNGRNRNDCDVGGGGGGIKVRVLFGGGGLDRRQNLKIFAKGRSEFLTYEMGGGGAYSK